LDLHPTRPPQIAAPTVSFMDMQMPSAEVHEAAAGDYKICLVLSGEARLSYQVDDRWYSTWLRPGMFAPITPPHVAATLHLSATQRHLMVSVSEAAFDRVAADSGNAGARLGTLCERGFRDPFLYQLCRQAWTEARRGDDLGQAFAHSIESTLICRLLRGSTGLRKRPVRTSSETLSATAMARIREVCESRLHERLVVADLAAVTGIGSHQFGRAFKASSGQSPQEYLISLRLQRARTLLRETDLAIAQVALACGFFDQSHLTSTFTRLIGMSPSRYRRQSA
jgi:AraC family transcriptional regulator